MATAPTDDPATPLSLAMRRYTRKVHRSSDALVNLKLALAFTDRQLYGQAIALFQPIYQRIEALLGQAAKTEPALAPVAKAISPGVARARAFEADLAFYLGADWKARVPSLLPEPLRAYLARLEEVAAREPLLLAVYAYHMHMALLSGGQILRRLARAGMRLREDEEGGTAIFDFPVPVAEVKEQLRAAVDGMEAAAAVTAVRKRSGNAAASSSSSSSSLRQSLLDESLRLFLMNNAVLATFDAGHRGRQAKWLMLLLTVVLFLLLLGLARLVWAI